MSKVFAFSTRVRRRGSQCCTAHHTSGSGCSGNEVGKNTRTNKRKKEETPLEDEDGKHAWDGASVGSGRTRCTINSRRGQVSLPAYTHCYDHFRLRLRARHRGDCPSERRGRRHRRRIPPHFESRPATTHRA